MRRTGWILITVLLSTLTGSAIAVRAQGACCTPVDCLPAADDAECSGLNGVFLDGEDCTTDPCLPAACCDGVNCGILGAHACITSGRTYAGAGVTCLDDPCDANIGVCCKNGSCSEDSPEDCATSGGAWLGAGTFCSQGLCDLGSCCRPGLCDNGALYECNAVQGSFLPGGDCLTDPVPCDVAGDCPLSSLASQSPDGPDAFTAYTSEAAASLQRWETYSGAVGPIDSLRWWGFDLDLVGGEFVECTENDNTFSISFHEDQAGQPGAAVCSYTLPVTATVLPDDYNDAVLNEYNVDLQTPCVLVDGWVSVVGQGDPDCWFVWLSSHDGDSLSYCDNCQVQQELDDLSYCIGGQQGGVFGACCNLSDGGCTDGVEIQNCVATGLRFTPDTLCSELNPPCVPTTGGCCFGDGNCHDDLPDSCTAAGGDWLGAGVSCDICPAVGACCFTQDSCSLETEEVCDSVGFTFVGVGTGCEQCPATPECDPASLFAQSPNDPDDFIAGSSEETSIFQRYEDFSAVAGAIESLEWWGLDMVPIGGPNFIECVETTHDFRVSFHEDAGGVPGAEVCAYDVTSSYTPTGIKYLGAELNAYGVTLPTPCVLVNGWVSIVGQGDPSCWFLWMSSDIFGDSWCDNCIPEAQDFDLNACFGGMPGGVFGACCDDTTVTCDDNTEITDCLDPLQRFDPDGTCAGLDPACGTVIGACCASDATCSIEQATDCQGGSWLGSNTLCQQCPCITPCPPGGIVEGEPFCQADYVDTFNGGCAAATQLFSPISLGDTVCGTSGMFFTAGNPDPEPDTDWYELTVVQSMELTFSAKAQFRPTILIFDAAGGCAGTPLAAEATLECDEASVTVEVEPGTYWLVILPSNFSDSSVCPSDYTATVTGIPLGLRLLLEPDRLVWNDQGPSERYDLIRGDLDSLRSTVGDFTVATEECLANNTSATSLSYALDPDPGAGWWFLMRTTSAAGNGSYDSSGPGQQGLRDAEIAASPLTCP